MVIAFHLVPLAFRSSFLRMTLYEKHRDRKHYGRERGTLRVLTYVVGVMKNVPACMQFMREAVRATVHFRSGGLVDGRGG